MRYHATDRRRRACRTRRSWIYSRSAAWVLCCAALLGNNGCIIPGRYDQALRFSHDNATAAWIHVDYLTMPLNYEQSMRQTAHVFWCKPDDPARVHSLRGVTVGPEWAGYFLSNHIQLSFSPDGRHLAVVAPQFLRIIDLTDGRARDLLPERELVSSLVWLNDAEVAYASHVNPRGRYREITDRSFWRQAIDAPANVRHLLHSEPGVKIGSTSFDDPWPWPLERWSPRGAYVLYQQGQFAPLSLLQVTDGSVRQYGPEAVDIELAAWKDDESAVACIMGVRGPGGQVRAVVIEPQTGRLTDFAAPLQANLGEVCPLGRESAWTPDGRYLLYNDLGVGGCLIEPAPFRCVRIAERLASRPSEGAGTYRVDLAEVAPFARSGWVRAIDPYRQGYLVDYEGTEVVPLGPIGDWWSLDGTLVASVERGGRLRFTRVSMPLTEGLPQGPASRWVESDLEKSSD